MMWFGGPVLVVAHVDAGRGRSRHSLDRLRALLGPGDRLEPTCHSGHAVELARRAAEDGWPMIAAAGGDGTAHEVACGVLDSGRDPTLVVLPLGSANDYAAALGLVPNWWCRPVPGMVRRRVDVGRVAWTGGSCWFVNGVGMGFNGLVTVESRKIKHFRGLFLYGMAVWQALGMPQLAGPWRVSVDGAMRLERPLMAVSVALGHREGNFTLTPRALLDDGLFDIVEAGHLSPLEVLSLLPRLIVGGEVVHGNVWQGTGKSVAIVAPGPVAAHADGELLCRVEDGVSALSIDLVPQRLEVLSGPGFRGRKESLFGVERRDHRGN